MNRNRLLVSALVCALTAPSLYGMQPSLSSYVELKSLFFKVAALCSEDTIKTEDLAHLLRPIKSKAIAHILGVDKATLKRYLDLKAWKKFLIQLTFDYSDTDDKAQALQKVIKVNAWQQLLGCQNLKPVIKVLTELFFFDGSAEDKHELLTQLKRALTKLQSDEQTLKKYIDLKKALSLVDAALGGQALSWADIVAVIPSDKLPTGFNKHLHLGNMLTFLGRFVSDEKPSPMELVSCVRLSSVIMNLPTLLGFDASLLPIIFDKEKLAAQIQNFQDKTPLVANELRATLNQKSLEQLHISQDDLDSYVDFNLLAKGLNKLRNGIKAPEIKAAFKLNLLENALGIDIQNAFSTDVPEEAQQNSFNRLVDHITNSRLYTTCKEGLPFFAAPIILWLFGHTFYHEYMEMVEPQHWYTAGPLFLATVYATMKGSHYLAQQVPLKVVVFNTTVVKASRVVNAVLQKEPLSHQKIMELIPNDHADRGCLKKFTSLLEPKHLDTLPAPECLIMLLDNPRAFVAQQEKFIESLYTHDQEQAEQRVNIVILLLERAQPLKTLLHTKHFNLFLGIIQDEQEVLRRLPHPSVMGLARYRPCILIAYPSFLKEAARFTLDDESAAVPFFKALEAAQPLEERDKKAQ